MTMPVWKMLPLNMETHMTDFQSDNPADVSFVDERMVDWANVRRTCCYFYQRFDYAYPGPIQNLRQRLMVIPADQYGRQRLQRYALTIDPSPETTRQRIDSFGNRVLELEVSRAEANVSFEVLMLVESEAHRGELAGVSANTFDQLRRPTRLTAPNARITGIAQLLRSQSLGDEDLAQRISDWVFGAMRYQSGVTTVATTAAEALAIGSGLCQDYAHVMLSICRAAGLAGRYVSGHLLGEGGSHAWVEILFPTVGGARVIAFDPTNHCRPDFGYITVAVGRDYSDVSPTSGSFSAPYGGQLKSSKRAGLTWVEYCSGDIVRA